MVVETLMMKKLVDLTWCSLLSCNLWDVLGKMCASDYENNLSATMFMEIYMISDYIKPQICTNKRKSYILNLMKITYENVPFITFRGQY